MGVNYFTIHVEYDTEVDDKDVPDAGDTTYGGKVLDILNRPADEAIKDIPVDEWLAKFKDIA